MKALGAPLRHFGFNRGWATFFGFGVLMFGTLGVATVTVLRRDSEWWEPVVGFVAFALNSYALVRTLVSSATVCEMGLRYKTLRGQGEMLWEEVEKFRYAILTTRHQGIIKTTQYTMTLVAQNGQRAELGSNVQRPKELAELLLERVCPIVLKKALAAYETGTPIDLGAIKLSREGLSVAVPFQKVLIPTGRVLGCTIDRGMVIVGARILGKTKNYTVPMRDVDNAFALVELVNTRVIQRSAAASNAH